MTERPRSRRTPAAKRVAETLDILRALNVPREQQNERSALTLLALLGMTPQKRWSEAKAPMLGITEMMDVFRTRFGKRYATNSRETVRRFTVHQFVQMGLVLANPDNPRRPVNSSDNRYQVAPGLLNLARAYGARRWNHAFKAFVRDAEALRRLQPRERDSTLIPVRLPDGRALRLTAGARTNL